MTDEELYFPCSICEGGIICDKCHSIIGDPSALNLVQLVAASRAALALLEEDFGNGIKNGYWPEVKPIIENLRAALKDRVV